MFKAFDQDLDLVSRVEASGKRKRVICPRTPVAPTYSPPPTPLSGPGEPARGSDPREHCSDHAVAPWLCDIHVDAYRSRWGGGRLICLCCGRAGKTKQRLGRLHQSGDDGDKSKRKKLHSVVKQKRGGGSRCPTTELQVLQCVCVRACACLLACVQSRCLH